MQQYAALPYVETPEGPLVLLVTSRDTGRWVIPKGWAKPKLTPRELAAREALEEAGITGDMGIEPIGRYEYTKRLHFLSWVRAHVEVYALLVDTQAAEWPERNRRRQLWCPPGEAALLVRERGLAALLRSFAPHT